MYRRVILGSVPALLSLLWLGLLAADDEPQPAAPADKPPAAEAAPAVGSPTTPSDSKPGAEAAAEVQADPEAPAAQAPDDKSEKKLSTSQEALVRRYKRFEETLVRMAELMKKTDPDRSALLLRAIGRSKEEMISLQLDRLVELLGTQRFGDAVDRQMDVVKQLEGLLDLLRSEDREKELAAEKARLEKLIKEVNWLIGKEKDLRAGTERKEAAARLGELQKKLAEQTQRLANTIQQQDAERQAQKSGGAAEGKPKSEGADKPGSPNDKPDADKPTEDGAPKPEDGQDKPASDEPKPDADKPADDGDDKPKDGKPKDGEPADGKPSDGKPNDGKPSDGKPADGKPQDGKPSDGKPSEGEPSEGQPSEGQPSESPPGESQPSQKPQGTPGQENIQKAREQMERAAKKLDEQKHSDASERQDEALRELEQARQKLEEVLRQLREEERERLLQALEARFQKMLAMQLLVYDGTVRLDKSPKADRSARHAAQSVKLARQEEEIAVEATKALALLGEEGSAVAFPEAVQQMRDDMRVVVGQLERSDVGELTQQIEKDIIEALEEMIEALQKEIEKAKDKKPNQGQPGQPQDPALVDKLAELKMLRSLQLRVNRRTKVLGRLVDGEQALKPEVIEQLQDLAGRQSRIQQATYDLATGKNK